MNNKFHVSYEAARLLKEKGYNEETIYYYDSVGKLYLGNGHFNYNAYAVNLSAPTKAEAIDWLEGKRIYISSIVDCDSVGVFYTARIIVYDNKNNYHNYSIFEDNDNRYMKIYKTRLEAEEAAIIKALELL